MITIHIAPGPPATGKSTFFARLSAETGAKIISPDNHVYNADGVYEWTPARAKSAWEAAYAEVASMSDGEVAIFDATQVDVKTRQSLMAKIRESHPDAVFVAWNLPNPGLDELFRRNDTRPEDRKIPRETITAMFNRWTPATAEEGFDIRNL